MSGFASQLTTRPLLLRRVFATVFLTMLLAATCMLSVIPSHAAPSGQAPGGAHGPVVKPTVTGTVTATPSGTETATPKGPRFYDRNSLIEASDKYAIEVKGMEDLNRNGIPDYREFYVVDYHDCAEHSATFDWLLEEMAKDGWLDYEQGMGAMQIRGSGHAANIVPGLGEVDVTPVIMKGRATASDGTPWHHWSRGYTPYQQGFPDPGEFTVKGYNGPRAQTMPGTPVPGTAGLGGRGGLLGGGSGTGFIGTLSQLMQRNGGGGLSGGGALGSGSKSTVPQTSGAKSPTKPPANATAPKTPAPVVVKPSPSAAPAPKPPVAVSPVPTVTSPAPQPPKGGLAMEIPSDKAGSSPSNGSFSAAPSGPSSIVPATGPANTGIGGASAGNSGVPSLGSLQKAAIDVFKENPSANSQPETTTRPSEMGTPVLKGASSTAGSDAMLDAKRPSAWDIPALSAVNGAADGTQNSKGFF